MSELPFGRALVTGASSGIGEAMVHRLSAAAVPTVVVARRQDRLDRLAADYAGVEVLVADLTARDDLERVADRIASADEPVDLVVNNAGFGTSGAFCEQDSDRLDSEIGVNVSALTRLSHAALSAMVPRHRGWLLNVSSVAGFQPAPNLAVYAATKAYVTSLSESLHHEVKQHGVNVTALCPGLTPTEFQQTSGSQSYSEKYPGWVWTAADDVAATALRDVAKGKPVSVPGALYKTMVAGAGITPRPILRRMAALVQRD